MPLTKKRLDEIDKTIDSMVEDCHSGYLRELFGPVIDDLRKARELINFYATMNDWRTSEEFDRDGPQANPVISILDDKGHRAREYMAGVYGHELPKKF